jgi:hypothetical protein
MALSDFDTSTHDWWDACSKTQTVGSVTFKLPSKMEWDAFGGQFGITSSNYPSKGLSDIYWSSTGNWDAYFGSGYMSYHDHTNKFFVRLCATF